MKQLSARAMRRELINGHLKVDQELIPAVNGLIENEQIMQRKIAALEQFTQRTLWQRLVWLVTGA